jgi:hypothetical protein
VISASGDTSRVEQIGRNYNRRTAVIGYAVHDPERRVWLPSHGLVGSNGAFRPTREKPPAYPSR